MWPWTWKHERDEARKQVAELTDRLRMSRKRAEKTEQSRDQWKTRYFKTNDDLGHWRPLANELTTRLAVADNKTLFLEAQVNGLRDELALAREDNKKLHEQLLAVASKSATDFLLQNGDPFAETKGNDVFLHPDPGDVDVEALQAAMNEPAPAPETTT